MFSQATAVMNKSTCPQIQNTFSNISLNNDGGILVSIDVPLWSYSSVDQNLGEEEGYYWFPSKVNIYQLGNINNRWHKLDIWTLMLRKYISILQNCNWLQEEEVEKCERKALLTDRAFAKKKQKIQNYLNLPWIGKTCLPSTAINHKGDS